MENDLRYTSEAVITECLFFDDLNDINLFVEDDGKEFEYETIFKRLLGEKYKITKILGVGGKIALKNCFKEFGLNIGNSSKIKNIYIADGDFDRYIYYERMIDSPCFIYLETYNIENYFIDKKASEEFAKGQLKCSDYEVSLKINFDNWKEKIIKQASRLFFYYCYIKKNFPKEKSVSRNPYLFINNKDGFERTGAFEEYKAWVLSLDANAEIEVEKIKKCYFEVHNDAFNLICGKFLFESLYCYIKSVTKVNFMKDSFRWHLVCRFDVNKLNYVKDRIINIMEDP